MPENSNWRIANETCVSKICAPSPDSGAEGQSRVNLHWPQSVSPKWSHLHVPVITGDESWVYGYDLESKQMPSQWKTASSPQPKKARQVKSNVKTMLVAFFDIDGLVQHEYVPRGRTVNKEFYRTVLQCLNDAVRRHRPEKWHSGNWILRHDNAPAHRAVTTNEFLAKHNIPSIPHPPYSPDLAPCDFFLFPQLKKQWKFTDSMMRFKPTWWDKWGLLQKVTTRGAFVTKSDYQRCFRQWQEHWNKCIQAQGHYFEGDKTN